MYRVGLRLPGNPERTVAVKLIHASLSEPTGLMASLLVSLTPVGCFTGLTYYFDLTKFNLGLSLVVTFAKSPAEGLLTF